MVRWDLQPELSLLLFDLLTLQRGRQLVSYLRRSTYKKLVGIQTMKGRSLLSGGRYDSVSRIRWLECMDDERVLVGWAPERS